MATRKSPLSNRNTVLASVTSSAFTLRENEAAAIKAIKDAGEGSKDTRLAFITGHLASSLSAVSRKAMTQEAAIEAARKAIKAAGATSTKPDRRTAAQETAYAAARKAWSRLTAKAGVKATDPRGGSRTPKVTKANEETTPAAPQVVAKATKVRTPAEASAIFGDIAALVRSIRDGSAKALTAAERDFATQVLTAFEAYAKATTKE